jgi:hypothetical protein
MIFVNDVTTSRDGCLVRHADGTGADREPVRHDGSALTWRLDDPRRPTVALSRSRLGIDDYDLVAPTDIPVTLDPVRRGARVVGWTVRTEPVGYGDFRLLLQIRWPREACGQDQAAYRYPALSLPALPAS